MFNVVFGICKEKTFCMLKKPLVINLIAQNALITSLCILKTFQNIDISEHFILSHFQVTVLIKNAFIRRLRLQNPFPLNAVTIY